MAHVKLNEWRTGKESQLNFTLDKRMHQINEFDL